MRHIQTHESAMMSMEMKQYMQSLLVLFYSKCIETEQLTVSQKGIATAENDRESKVRASGVAKL